MLKINKINLKVLELETNLGDSRLEFKISGSNIDYIIANTIRRTIFADVPIFAFNQFTFEKNSSIFHNNYIKLRLQQMPVWGIENTVDFIDLKMNNNFENKDNDNDADELNKNNDDNIDMNLEKDLNFSTLKQLTMYVNMKNKTNDILSVSTKDAKFYFDEKQITSPYKFPVLLVKLQPNQEIIFSAITNIGTEAQNAMYSPVSVVFYKQINDNMFDFCLESRGQINEKNILLVAIKNIDKRVNNLLKYLLNEFKNNKDIDYTKSEGTIIISGEDNTLGNLIARGMQQHESISFAGYNLPHPLGGKVHFTYKLKKGGHIKKIMEDVCNYYIELFSKISDLITTEVKDYNLN